MSRADKERQDRLQRMLAREQGMAPPDARLSEQAKSPADVPPAGFSPPPEPRSGPDTGKNAEAPGKQQRRPSRQSGQAESGGTAAGAARQPPAAEAEPGPVPDREKPAGGKAGDAAENPPPAARPGGTEPPPADNLHPVDFSRRAPRKRSRRPLSPILRRRKRRRRLMVAAALLAAALVFAWVSGALARVMMTLGDLADTMAISFEAGDWPVTTGIDDPIQIQPLAGGFVELGDTDVAVVSPSGALLRTIQPGYARPAIAAGNNRFVLYNRAANGLRIESRTRTLYNTNTESSILLCAMSPNGTTAVVTESARYAARLEVLDPVSFGVQYEWFATEEDGTPVAVSFAKDNRRFAAGCISASDGQVATRIYLMDTAADAPTAIYTAQPGELVLRLNWLSTDRVLVLMDDAAVVLDAAAGTEVARYEYGGASLLDADWSDTGIALLLAGQGSATLTVLNNDLTLLSSTEAGSAADVLCTRTGLYLSGGMWVRCLNYDGTQRWERALESPALAMLDAEQPLLFTGMQADLLQP